MVIAADEKPESFAYRVNIQNEGVGAIQRLSIPAGAMPLLRSRDGADIRVFNASGQAVPYSRLPVTSQAVPAQAQSFPLFPIQMSTSSVAGSDVLNTQLRIEERAGQRIVTLGTSKTPKGPLPSATTTELAGYLLDTRDLKNRLDYLELDVDLPIGEPIPITISASNDLRNWRMLVESSPVFRFGPQGSPGNVRVGLAGASLAKDYLRITWPKLTGNAASIFKIKGVRIAESPTVTAQVKQEFELPVVAGENTHQVIAKLSSTVPIRALSVSVNGTNVLIPTQIFVRENRTQAWRLIASAGLYRMASGATTIFNPPIELPYENNNRAVGSVVEYKLEADKNSLGFVNNMPTIKVITDTINIAFLASGQGPFSLALGLAEAKPLALPLTSLIPGYAAGTELALPQAKVLAETVAIKPTAAPTALEVLSEKTGAVSSKSMILWAVLLAGVVLMGALVVGLMRQLKTSAASTAKKEGDPAA